MLFRVTWPRHVLLAVVCQCFALTTLYQSTSLADEKVSVPRWREVWAGGDATAHGWLIYSGMTVAPTSAIHDQGLRFRLASGYGGYDYSGFRRLRGKTAELKAFEARTGFAEILLGYLWRLDPLIVKVFGGASAIDHQITPYDNENLAYGLDWGAKGVVELWLNMGESMWGSADLTWSGAHDTRSARARLGYRLRPNLSIGVEGRFNIDEQGDCDIGWDEAEGCKLQYRPENEETTIIDYSRAGAFVRYEWQGGEISASTGIAAGILGRDTEDDANPYFTVNWISQF
jgi:hypothetical protein